MNNRTLFTTADPFCAGLAGFDGPTEPGWDGGFSVALQAGAPPTVTITLTDSEIVGRQALRQLADALLTAERLTRQPSE